MKDPRKAGHEPVWKWTTDEQEGHESCLSCDTYWPCSTVEAYDSVKSDKARRKNVGSELDKLTARVNDLESKCRTLTTRAEYYEKFIWGAAMPVIRDLLATHATGSLDMPSSVQWASGLAPDSGKGTGVNFAAGGTYYAYRSTDGREYRDGRVVRGASVAKVAEQRKRFE